MNYCIIEDMNKRDSPHTQPMASLTMAAIGGSIESWSGMRIWHHKTMRKKVKYRFSGIIILKVALLFYQQENI